MRAIQLCQFFVVRALSVLEDTFPTEDKDFTLYAFTYLGTVSDDFDDEGTMTVVHTG